MNPYALHIDQTLNLEYWQAATVRHHCGSQCFGDVLPSKLLQMHMQSICNFRANIIADLKEKPCELIKNICNAHVMHAMKTTVTSHPSSGQSANSLLYYPCSEERK